MEISFWKGGSLFLEFGKRIEFVSPQPIFSSLGVEIWIPSKFSGQKHFVKTCYLLLTLFQINTENRSLLKVLASDFVRSG